MGTFLYTGIINRFCFDLSEKSAKKTSLDRLKTKVAKAVVGDLNSFTCEGKESFYSWNWKREARRKYLVPFLKRYYSDFYGKDSEAFEKYCKPIVSFLNNDPSDEDLIDWAEEEGYEFFGPMNGWLRYVTIDGQRVRVNVSFISLSSEGKVIVEEIEEHQSFFENALRLVYRNNPFGKCLTVDVG
ncbi:MAG: hypothetical protein JST68_29765 [Bacteroidetes bacterium]|nr:hypothetical protein [Bacteroidota bacterium]